MSDKYDDYIHRAQLAIDGYERGEHVSTWVVEDHLKESLVLLAQAHADKELLLKEIDSQDTQLAQAQTEIEILKSEANIDYRVAYAEAANRFSQALADDMAVMRTQLAEAQAEIERLAQFIIHDVPGEPSKSEGAVDTAIRVIITLRTKLAEMRRLLVERHRCSLDPLCGVCKWLAANKEAK